MNSEKELFNRLSGKYFEKKYAIRCNFGFINHITDSSYAILISLTTDVTKCFMEQDKLTFNFKILTTSNLPVYTVSNRRANNFEIVEFILYEN